MRSAKAFLSNEVAKLQVEKKNKFGNVDITQPMSSEEKDLTSKIASAFSKINEINQELRKLK